MNETSSDTQEVGEANDVDKTSGTHGDVESKADVSQGNGTESADSKQGDSRQGKEPSQRTQSPGVGRMSERRQRMELKRKRGRRAGIIRTVLIALAALAAGLGVGYAVPSLVPAAPGSTIATPTIAPSNPSDQPLEHPRVSEAELATPLGAYAYKGATTQVTVREAIEESMSLDAARNAEGNYDVPSADSVLAVARNRLLLKDAESRGISADDAVALAYAKDEWGTEDLGLIAANYSMTKDQVAKLMKESATLRKLRNEVVASESPAAPEAPAAPEDGKNDDPRPEYAAYIMGLVGDEWDKTANTWAKKDGPYHEKLKNYTISSDSATYSAAQAAYDVAREQQAAAERQLASKWTAYVNKILAEVTVSLNTLVI